MGDSLHDRLYGFLGSRIWGQDTACKCLAELVSMGELGWHGDSSRPCGSALLLGPTGVGKTELVLQLGRFLDDWYDESWELVRFDMAQYRHAGSVRQCVGAGPDEMGDWGSALQRLAHRRALLLFDECEKAAPEVLPLFLSLLDTGTVRTADGILQNACQHYLFFTSNLASADLVRMQRLPAETRERQVLRALEKTFSPELAARFDQRIVLQPLSRPVINQIAHQALTEALQWITHTTGMPVFLHREEELLPWLQAKVHWIYHRQKLGARIVRQSVRQWVCSAFLHADRLPSQRSWLLSLHGDQLTLSSCEEGHDPKGKAGQLELDPRKSDV